MNQVKTFLLLAALSALVVAIGGVVGGSKGALIALVIAFVMNIGSYWFSDKVVLRMYHAQEITEAEAPELYHIVHDLAMNAEIPMPKLYIIPDPSPNAFATGRNPDNAAVAVTEGILQLLSREELAGVLAHELAHVKNRDILIQTIASTIGAAITYLAYFGMFFGRSDDDEGGSPITGILLVVLAPLAATIIQLAISRSREYLADSTGGQICGKPLWLASALNKLQMGVEQVPMHSAQEATAPMFIVHPFLGGIGKLFSTHPPIPERIERLKEQAGVMG
jgi:heat shock protein HtpX